jgi:hypothetical protein
MRCAVLQLFPFAAWLAAAVSVALIVMLRAAGELGPRAVALAVGWLLAAAACQCFGRSATVALTRLVLQTLLAIELVVRWRLDS